MYGRSFARLTVPRSRPLVIELLQSRLFRYQWRLDDFLVVRNTQLFADLGEMERDSRHSYAQFASDFLIGFANDQIMQNCRLPG